MSAFKDKTMKSIEEAIENANVVKAEGRNPREISLVITKLQEARLWLGEVKD